jgi:hypothetical protein
MDEIQRLQKLAGINEIKVNKPEKLFYISKYIKNYVTKYFKDIMLNKYEGKRYSNIFNDPENTFHQTIYDIEKLPEIENFLKKYNLPYKIVRSRIYNHYADLYVNLRNNYEDIEK